MTIKYFHIKRIWEIVKNRLLKGFLTHCLLQFLFLLPFFLPLRKCAILLLHSTPAHGHSFTKRPVLSLNQNMDEKAAGWNWTWAIQKASHSQGNFSQHLCSGTHWAWPHLLLLSLVNSLHRIPADKAWNQSFTRMLPSTLPEQSSNS